MSDYTEHSLLERQDAREEGPYTDAFGRRVTKRTNFESEIGSHYSYNPERWRLYVNDNRQFIQYNSVNQYAHNGSEHVLSPSSGETLVLESSERPRYTVQYEIAATWALALTQELASGDRLRVGLYDGTDGWYLEQTGSHAPDTADLVVESAGTVTDRATDVDIHTATTNLARFLLRTGWYRVTRQIWERSYVVDGDQQNPVIGRTGDLDTEGPKVGNLPLRFELTASSTTQDLSLRAGSTAFITYGDPGERVRQKTHSFTASIGTTGSWVPVHAIRVDPSREIVNTQIADADIVAFSGSGDVRVMPVSVDPSKTDASSWQTPVEHSAMNSVVEIAGSRSSPAVTTFPDSAGGVVSSAANPGGYQLGYSSWYATGTGTKTNVFSGGKTRKRGIESGDIAVFLANASTTGDITVEVITEQDW